MFKQRIASVGEGLAIIYIFMLNRKREKMKKPLTIKDYHDNRYLVNLEEDYDNVFYAIKYEDHGDTFVVVYMKDDKIFEYGWWDDRYDFGNYIRDHELFAKKVPRYTNPFVCGDFYKWDIRNKIRGLIKDLGLEELSEEYLQSKFDEIIEMLDIAYNTGYEYDWSSLKNDVVKYFKKHNLYSSDNHKRCKHAHWSSKLVNGCRGIAAKKDRSRYDQFSCDKLLSVWYDGEWHKYPYRNIPYKIGDFDEWGFCQEIYNYQKVKNYLAQTVLF